MTTHDLFVAAAYAIAAAGVFGLVLWVLIDGRLRKAELRALEAEGIRRRSDPSGFKARV